MMDGIVGGNNRLTSHRAVFNSRLRPVKINLSNDDSRSRSRLVLISAKAVSICARLDDRNFPSGFMVGVGGEKVNCCKISGVQAVCPAATWRIQPTKSSNELPLAQQPAMPI